MKNDLAVAAVRVIIKLGPQPRLDLGNVIKQIYPKICDPKTGSQSDVPFWKTAQFRLCGEDSALKCQQCDKQAAFHITDLTGDGVSAVHLCPSCAKGYLQPEDETQEDSPETADLVSLLSKQLKIGQTAEQLAKLDQKVCPVCGITFLEFRKQGRLGCPHDYDFFAEELEPLIVNIHGETAHCGKSPANPAAGDKSIFQLIRLRREMNEAAENEDYEVASKLRDEIKALEGKK